MVKKIICLIAVLLLAFSFSVSAKEEFLVHGKDDLSSLLNMSTSEIDTYCKENNITYFAVNRDNTKQIKRIEYEDEFSKEVKDLSILTDGQIWSMASELSGFPDVLGNLVYDGRGDYKFLKTEHKTKDSGGEYVITQFVTVKDSKKITLSFYTAANADREYIDSVLEEQFPEEKNYKSLISVGIILFFLMALGATLLIIRDLKNNKD